MHKLCLDLPVNKIRFLVLQVVSSSGYRDFYLIVFIFLYFPLLLSLTFNGFSNIHLPKLAYVNK